MNDAACAGRWELFDSTNRADHEIARRICQGCTMRLTCRALLDACATSQAARHGGPQGTWAGILVGRAPDTMPELPLEARRARAAYVKGDRSDWAKAGNRIYERTRTRMLREVVA